MKIAKIDQFFPRPRIRLVKVTTDSGLVGWGETTLEGKPRSTAAAVEELADYLVGKDPLLIEHHCQSHRACRICHGHRAVRLRS